MDEPARSRRDSTPPLRLVQPAAAVAADAAVVESYRRLADVFHDLLSEQSLDSLLVRIAETLAEIVPYDALHIYEADEAQRRLTPTLVRSEWEDEVLSDSFEYGVGITGWAVERRVPVLANEAHLDPRVAFVPGTPLEPEALIVVPLVARASVKGTLNLYRIGEASRFDGQEFELAKRFGDAAALALDNAHIRARLEHQAQTDALTGLYNHRTFHERLRNALTHASAQHESVALVMLDIDDFKKVNDVYGHAVGDRILTELAGQLRSLVRAADVVCRVGGEEFAVILPSAGQRQALALAGRLAERLEGVEFEDVGRIAVSVGVAEGPTHAANPRELVACAEAAMMTAKARGKNQVVLFDEAATERPDAAASGREELRSIAHLKMLQSLGGKLSRLVDVHAIGMAVANELRLLIDYHNCRVFLRDGEAGERLIPIAFQGQLTHARNPALEVLEGRVDEGFTGYVVRTGRSLLLADASECEYAVRIAGTAEIEESVVAVPLNYGARVIGAIVISKLGLDQFDGDDLRLLEVLAGHAAVALENARLYEAQRREAESAHALLAFGRDLAAAEGLDDVLARVVEGAARVLGGANASLWLQEASGGDVVCLSGTGYRRAGDPDGRRYAAADVEAFLAPAEPYLLEPARYAELADDPGDGSGSYAVAPFGIEGRRGAIAVGARADQAFDARHLELLGGLAHQAKLAIANASSFESLERTFLSTVEALANALEARDEYTSSHASWISDMALRVGEELGLDAEALKRLELGALFHDIGKIGIPNAVLLKAGPLTAEERALIETHPELGQRILAPIDQLGDVCTIVRSCHERWDGAGYPDGKSGERIPLEARIIFACDAFHAMTTDRPYRNRLSVDEARRRLRSGAGTQFDPRIVEVCLRLLERPPA